MSGIEKASFYISVEPLKIELAASLYINVFKAKKIGDTYPDGSIELKILGTSVFVTSGNPCFSSIIELRTDSATISLVKQNAAFLESDVELNLPDKDILKFIDPFQVIWLLREKKFSDGSRCLPSCPVCQYPANHRPALCSEMRRWQIMIPELSLGESQSIDPQKFPIMLSFYRKILSLEQELTQIREHRAFYEMLDARSFCGELSTTLDELESMNSLFQGIFVTIALNPTYHKCRNFAELFQSAWNGYNNLLVSIQPSGMGTLPNPCAIRKHAADQMRQLVKRCQSARSVMNKYFSTIEEIWMDYLLYEEVPSWREQDKS